MMASGPDSLIDERPVRGTRPSNRRELIIAAAARLFYRQGFTRTSMGEIAEAVAIGPSALYRHFRSKGDLLKTVVDDSFASMRDRIAQLDSGEFDELADGFAPVLVKNREIGVLWRRESRNLEASVRAEAQEQVREVAGSLAGLISIGRPDLTADDADLLSWCVFGVATSISFHQLNLPHDQLVALLVELVDSVLHVELPEPEEPSPPTPDAMPFRHSRRETILATAIQLFSQHGYSQVGMEDIGAAVGIAGPSVYNHFSSKADLLIVGTVRSAEWLRMDLLQALRVATDPVDGLCRLLRSYSSFVLASPYLVDLLITELDQLAEADRRRARQAQLDYIGEWVHLLQSVHPEMDAVSARIRVQATLSMMSDVALILRLRQRPGLAAEIAAVGARILAVD